MMPKFRVWINGRMEAVTSIDFDVAGAKYIHFGNNYCFQPDCFLMQSTDLKDKNGKGIYESDIVKWNDGGNSWRVAVVEIKPDIGFRIIRNSIHKLCKDTTEGEMFHFGNFIYSDTEIHLTVVGNIHENPELLKGVEG